MQKNLELGRYSDEELLELAEGDVHGGSSPACITTVTTVTVPSAMDLCPTTACTDSC